MIWLTCSCHVLTQHSLSDWSRSRAQSVPTLLQAGRYQPDREHSVEGRRRKGSSVSTLKVWRQVAHGESLLLKREISAAARPRGRSAGEQEAECGILGDGKGAAGVEGGTVAFAVAAAATLTHTVCSRHAHGVQSPPHTRRVQSPRTRRASPPPHTGCAVATTHAHTRCASPRTHTRRAITTHTKNTHGAHRYHTHGVQSPRTHVCSAPDLVYQFT
eukprot:2636182-Rhodomonas_salina.1